MPVVEVLYREDIKWYSASMEISPGRFAIDCEKSLQRLKSDNFVERFDAVIVAWPELERNGISDAISEEIYNARFIVFVDLRSEYHRDMYAQVLTQETHVVIDDMTAKGDYVILKKKAVARWRESKISAYSSAPI